MAPREKDAESPAAPAGLRPSIHAVAIASLIVYVAVMTLFKMSNNDIWIHMKTGEYVLKNGWVPIKDPYSFIAADHDYVAHEWLAGVLFYLVYSAAGVTGLIWFKAAVLAASNALLYGAARSLRARMSVILPAFTCLLYIASARYLERPHIFSYLMAALYLFLFLRYRERGRRRVWLYLLVPSQIVWANLHGGWVQGMAMVCVFAFGELLAWLRARRPGPGADRAPSGRDVAILASLVPACAAATLLNPYGLRIMTFPFELTRLKLFMSQIYEWQPPYSVSYNCSTMFFFYLIHLAGLCLFFFLSQRDRTRGRAGSEELAAVNAGLIALLAIAFVVIAASWSASPPASNDLEIAKEARLHHVLYFVLVLFCAFTVVNLRSVDFTLAGLVALFFFMSLQHNRAVTDSAMATFPILAAAGSALLDRRTAERGDAVPARTGPKRTAARTGDEPAPSPARPAFVDRSSPGAVWAGSILMLAVSAHAAIFTYYFDFKGSGREKGFAIADNMPTCAVDFIERHHITGNAFVSYAYAAMLIHRMHPAVKVNMDSRNDVYGEDLYREFLSALRSPEGMKTYLERHPIDFFIMGYGDRLPATFDWLASTNEWAPVYYDDRGFILLKRKPENEALIRELELRVLKPSVIGAPEINAQNAAIVLEEADRCIASCPKALMPYFFKSKALLFLGRIDEALAASGEVLKRDPDNVLAYADMAMTYAATGRTDRAIEMYEAALRIAPDFTLARENLRRLRGF